MIQNLHVILALAKLSDHGLMSHLVSLWDHATTPYSDRLETLIQLQPFQAGDLYKKLETLTSSLQDISSPTYDLISDKERQFGNFSSAFYFKQEHTSELHGLRLQIAKGLDSFRRQHKKELQWWGVTYSDVLKQERVESEARAE